MGDLLQWLANNIFLPFGRFWGFVWFFIRFGFSQLFFTIIMVITFALSVIKSVYKIVDKIVYEVEKVIIVLALIVMTIAVLLVAVDRWFEWVNFGWFWLTKLAMFLMIWAGFMGASVATKRREHITIDISSKVLTLKGGKIATFFSQAFSAGFCFYMAKLSYLYMAESFRYGDKEGVFPIPLWIIQLVLPITLSMMGARFIENIFRGSKENEDLEASGIRPDPVVMKSGADTSMAVKDIILAGLFPGLVLGSLLAFKLSLSIGWLVFINCLFLFFIGTPLFVLIGLACVFCVILIGNGDPINIPIDMFDAVKKETLLAIPLFILAGGIMTAGSISTKLIETAKSIIGHLPGGLAVSTVLACLFFAAISGSSPVTVIAIGSIMFPALLKEKYDEDFSLGLVSSAGTLGILIPPSIPMIIYAIMAPVDGKALSVRELFVAGVIPGLLVVLILCIYSIFKQDIANLKVKKFDIKKVLSASLEGSFSLILIVLIFFGIYFGIFTAVEAAAVAVAYAALVEFFLQPALSYGRQGNAETKQKFSSFIEMKPSEVPKVFLDSCSIMGALFVIIVIAMALNRFLCEEQIPQAAAAWLSAKVSTKIGFLFLVNIFLLLLGCVMDIISAILIVAPLLAPIAIYYGVDPIHFGIIFIVNLQIGYITPPIGINLFVASGVFKKPIVQVIRGTLPFVAILLIALLIVTYVPAFSLILLGR
ncbi:MAG: TRAP transporter large permease subunit [Deltaproteobacteria bacterium]|nr:TRAP transporter large permease subunit [Deltaproteobacteria bacterium]MBW2217990.1 TRAP transporter large permease subunit [Deltaproteobacteria bacterium]